LTKDLSRLLSLSAALLLPKYLRCPTNYLRRLLPSFPSPLRLLRLTEDLGLRPLLRLSLLPLPTPAACLRLRPLLSHLKLRSRLLPHLKLGLWPLGLLTHLWRRSSLGPAASAVATTAATAIAATAAVTVAAPAPVASALGVRGTVRTG
jgi:hypothetical protein